MSSRISTDVSEAGQPVSDFDTQDPRWTAYVLGELEPADRQACDTILGRSAEARRFVDELRELSLGLEAELRAEPLPALTGAQREVVTLSALENRPSVPSKAGNGVRWKRWGASLALTLAVAGGVALLPTGRDGSDRGPQGTFVADNSRPQSLELAAMDAPTDGVAPADRWEVERFGKAPVRDELATTSMGREPVTRGLNREAAAGGAVTSQPMPGQAWAIKSGSGGVPGASPEPLGYRAPASGPATESYALSPIAAGTKPQAQAPHPVALSAPTVARSKTDALAALPAAPAAAVLSRGYAVARGAQALTSVDRSGPAPGTTEGQEELLRQQVAKREASPRPTLVLSERSRRMLGTELEARHKVLALGVAPQAGAPAGKDGKPGSTSQLFRRGSNRGGEADVAKGKESGVERKLAENSPARLDDLAEDFKSGVRKSGEAEVAGRKSLARKGEAAESKIKAGDKVADLAKKQSGDVKELEKLQAEQPLNEAVALETLAESEADMPALLPGEPALAAADGEVPAVDPAQVRYVMAKVEAEHRERLRQLQGQERVLELQQNAVDYDSLQQLSTGHNTESYDYVADNTFNVALGETALSTFSIDVDTASYANVRRFLTNGQIPPRGAVRIEELVNYFPYNDAPPTEDQPFTARVEIADCPWQPDHRLARIALKGKTIAKEARPVSNLVFLIDVSGSMQDQNKLPLVREGLRMLVNQLAENDRVAMVVYAGASGLVLPPTNATEKQVILSAIDNLQAGGSTNGGAGIELAYKTAKENFIKGGTNRVILCTDGDFNVGVSDRDSLVRMVEENAKSNVFLTILGYGMGNIKDATLEQLADKGNGQYGYIDSLAEARKWMVDQMQGTLITIAKDVKIQVEFNPAKVAGYRLIGYENRVMANQDFRNDAKDAGEIGAGHSVTALYELVPAGKTVPTAAATNEFKYQFATTVKPDAQTSDEFLTIRLRHKQPEGDKASEQEFVAKDTGLKYGQASEDFRFSAAVAAFGMILRDSPYKAQATLPAVKELAEAAKGSDPAGYRAEFVELVKRAEQMLPPPVVVEAAAVPADPAPAAAPESPKP